MERWYKYDKEQISGPFSFEEVRSQSSQNSFKKCHFWSNSVNKWINGKECLRLITDGPTSLVKKTSKLQTWHYAQGDDSFGPFTRNELIAKLKDTPDYRNTLIWTEGMSEWVPFFNFAELIEAVGIEQRQHARVKIEGNIQVHHNETTTLVGKLNSISEGGCGFILKSDLLKVGNEITLEIKTPYINTELKARCEIRYMHKNGYVGVAFKSIGHEAKNQIISYIRNIVTRRAA